MSKLITTFIVLVYIALLVGVFLAAWLLVMPDKLPYTFENWRSFAAAATVGVTAVSAIMAAVLSIRTAALQAKTSANLERVKQVLDKRIPAHGDMYGAAQNYYRMLAPLELGIFDVDHIEAAEMKMKEAEGLVVYVDEQFSSAWLTFWHDCRFIMEDVNKNHPDKESRQKYWREQAKLLGTELKALKEMARSEFLRPIVA